MTNDVTYADSHCDGISLINILIPSSYADEVFDTNSRNSVTKEGRLNKVIFGPLQRAVQMKTVGNFGQNDRLNKDGNRFTDALNVLNLLAMVTALTLSFV